MYKSKTTKRQTSEEAEPITTVSLYQVDDLTPHHCGYCDEEGSVSVGISAESMTIQDYQLLIDRGWRRSGTYIYKPVMNQTCCPLYTIKNDALHFKLRKSQKNTLKAVAKYLEINEIKKKSNHNPNENEDNIETKPLPTLKKKNTTKSNGKTVANQMIEYFCDKKTELSDDLRPENILNKSKLKAKHKRLFNKLKKLNDKNLITEPKDVIKYLKRANRLGNNEQMELEKLLTLDKKQLANKLEIRLVRSWPPTKEFQQTLIEEHQIYSKYQTTIHKDSIDECNMKQFERFLCVSPLVPKSHKGPLSHLDLNNIFEQHPNLDKNLIGQLTSLGYGSFHQQYVLNGKIIAVGVIDILDKCVSSVYFFYDPFYSFLNLGTYSALREIEFVRQLNQIDPSIKWYYLGFYVHSCRKMRYKGFYRPSYLACPEVFTWHPIEECVELLDKSKYSRLAPNPVETNESAPNAIVTDLDANESIDQVQIKVKLGNSDPRVFKFNEFCELLNPSYVPRFKNLISGYCKLFGKTLSKRILIKF